MQKNASSKACRQKKNDELTVEVREQKNEKIREKRVQRRKSMSVIEKGESSAHRKANYDRRKKTPCNECIVIPLTGLASSTSECPTSPSRASPASRDANDSTDGDPGTNMPRYTAGADGMKLRLSAYYAHSQHVVLTLSCLLSHSVRRQCIRHQYIPKRHHGR